MLVNAYEDAEAAATVGMLQYLPRDLNLLQNFCYIYQNVVKLTEAGLLQR